MRISIIQYMSTYSQDRELKVRRCVVNVCVCAPVRFVCLFSQFVCKDCTGMKWKRMMWVHDEAYRNVANLKMTCSAVVCFVHHEI